MQLLSLQIALPQLCACPHLHILWPPLCVLLFQAQRYETVTGPTHNYSLSKLQCRGYARAPHLHVFWPSLCVLLLQAECNVQAHVLGVGLQCCFELISIQHTAGTSKTLGSRVIYTHWSKIAQRDNSVMHVLGAGLSSSCDWELVSIQHTAGQHNRGQQGRWSEQPSSTTVRCVCLGLSSSAALSSSPYSTLHAGQHNRGQQGHLSEQPGKTTVRYMCLGLASSAASSSSPYSTLHGSTTGASRVNGTLESEQPGKATVRWMCLGQASAAVTQSLSPYSTLHGSIRAAGPLV
jgi:hypothetical protein